MKRYTFVLILAILSFGCVKENIEDSIADEIRSNFDLFSIYGEVHNEMLQYAFDNFVAPETITTQTEGIEYILQLQQSGVDKLDISENNKGVLKYGMNHFKDLYITDNIHKMLAVKTRVIDDEVITTNDIKQLIYEAYLANDIDEFEYHSFNELIDCVVANAQGLIGVQEFTDKINALIECWEIKYADVDFSSLNQNGTVESDVETLPDGALGGAVLSVSISSMEFWDDEISRNETIAIPAFVGADIAGAIIGACVNGGIQYLNKKEIDGESLLYAAVGSAIVGSTGIVGKLGNWLTNLMNTML